MNRSLPRFSLAHRASRFGIGLLGLIGVWLTLAITLPAVAGPAAPDLAVAGFPPNYHWHVIRDAAALTDPDANSGSDSVRAELARVIAKSPLEVEGVRTLALWNISSNDPRSAARLFDYAHALSRRDSETELWLIDQSARKGDVDGALAHYDHALRTDATTRGILLPNLIVASANPLVSQRLESLLAERPPWWIYFSEMFVGSFENSNTAAAILMALRLDPNSERERGVLIAGMRRLIAQGNAVAASALWRQATGAKGAAGQVVNGSFERSPSLPPFDWELANEPDLAASIEPIEGVRGAYALTVSAGSDRSGIAAKQLLRLPPGSYRASALMGRLAPAASQRPTIVIACAASVDKPLTVLTAGGNGPGTSVSERVIVPPKCPEQWLLVRIAGGNDPRDPAWVDDIRIVRQ